MSELQVRLRFYGEPVLRTIDKKANSMSELEVRLRFHVGIASKATVLWRPCSPDN
jgi:hypothetical protein